MKKYSIYLHQEIIDTLECFGALGDVINKAIRDCINGNVINNISPAPSRNDARRVEVYIKSELINELAGVPIRSFVYWFVENEVYYELNWQTSREYGQKRKEKLEKQFDKTMAEICKLDKMFDGKMTDIIKELESLRCSL